jgi:hypothetical protein
MLNGLTLSSLVVRISAKKFLDELSPCIDPRLAEAICRKVEAINDQFYHKWRGKHGYHSPRCQRQKHTACASRNEGDRGNLQDHQLAIPLQSNSWT